MIQFCKAQLEKFEEFNSVSYMNIIGLPVGTVIYRNILPMTFLQNF